MFKWIFGAFLLVIGLILISIPLTLYFDRLDLSLRGKQAIAKIIDIKPDRITSYNVCYTKLLRDELTLKTAQKQDIWLHTHNITGSHVIIITNGEIPTDKTIEEACVIAAFHSRITSYNVCYTKLLRA